MFVWGNRAFGCDVIRNPGKAYPGKYPWLGRSWLRQVYSKYPFNTKAEAVAWAKGRLKMRGRAGAKTWVTKEKRVHI